MNNDFRISNLGLFCVGKEPMQDHQPHPTYAYPEFLRIDSLGLLCVNKEPYQEHHPHPTYAYPEELRLEGIGIFATYGVGLRPAKTYIRKINTR